jgi:hypothetical protein
MTLTVTQVINIRSRFKVGAETDIPPEDVAVLEVMAGNRLDNIIGGRAFKPDEITEMTALIILDYLQNKPGHGAIVQETVTDNTWKNKGIATSSQWLDEVYAKVAEYDAREGVTSHTSGACHTQDEHINGIIDGYYNRGANKRGY